MNNANSDTFADLEKSLGYIFKNKGLLRESLTHSSYSYENNLTYNYERFEFLGDAVIEMAVSEYIVTFFPHFDEGKMSTLRAYVVSEVSLSTIAESLGIANYVYLGKGEEIAVGTDGLKSLKKSMLADIFEAIIAAIYLDSGFGSARGVLLNFVQDRINQGADTGDFIDAKSEAQRICQKLFNTTPEYIIISETGPDHEKFYCVETNMCGLSYGKGYGPSKKKAEKDAAAQALKAYLQKLENE